MAEMVRVALARALTMIVEAEAVVVLKDWVVEFRAALNAPVPVSVMVKEVPRAANPPVLEVAESLNPAPPEMVRVVNDPGMAPNCSTPVPATVSVVRLESVMPPKILVGEAVVTFNVEISLLVSINKGPVEGVAALAADKTPLRVKPSVEARAAWAAVLLLVIVTFPRVNEEDAVLLEPVNDRVASALSVMRAEAGLVRDTLVIVFAAVPLAPLASVIVTVPSAIAFCPGRAAAVATPVTPVTWLTPVAAATAVCASAPVAAAVATAD